ncbi:hypothetical protein K491DRAFT_212612 [Lophiostoma macrostomum CBS 122681]|uniref:Uncharacterized protein n=1 Tax=Lophiostoma macrostomum CBS 122681 TaxID=1314788 RepID=A0A6A6SQC1_9PLEO|nr:hypothetical protein K491DRAFT_212612 [Lophiostoma macrostomum CBS 122681]
MIDPAFCELDTVRHTPCNRRGKFVAGNTLQPCGPPGFDKPLTHQIVSRVLLAMANERDVAPGNLYVHATRLVGPEVWSDSRESGTFNGHGGSPLPMYLAGKSCIYYLSPPKNYLDDSNAESSNFLPDKCRGQPSTLVMPTLLYLFVVHQ